MSPDPFKEVEQLQGLEGETLRKMLSFAVDWLAKSESDVNALNVFPVPDGDTGTNMLLTMRSSLEEAFSSPGGDVSSVMKALAHGALMGARGNSGVILSQIWRGMAGSINGKETLSGADLAKAFQGAAQAAYEAIENPVEGTMLTVIKDMASSTVRYIDNGDENVSTVLRTAVEAAGKSVANTPNLLPVLKEAGVVDSGGEGLYILFEGTLMYIENQTAEFETGKSKIFQFTAESSNECEICINNINEQVNGAQKKQIENKVSNETVAIVAVATGQGIVSIFKKLGASAVIPGGQTMNPSTKQILQAVETIDPDKVIILPNDKNLVLVARQIITLTDKTVEVVPTVTIPQGIAALLAFNPQADLQTNTDLMSESKSMVRTIEITHAIRSSKIKGLSIHKNQAIGLLEGKLLAADDDLNRVILSILDKVDLASAETISIYFGAETTKAEADEIRNLMYRKNSRLNVDVLDGGQPLYNYIISIE